MKTPIVLPNPFIFIHALYQKYLERHSIYGICKITDETCYIKDKHGYLAYLIENPFFYKFVSKI